MITHDTPDSPKNQAYALIVAAPIYHWGIVLNFNQSAIIRIDLLMKMPATLDLPLSPNAILTTIHQQLQAYLTQPQYPLQLPIAPTGTAFQQRVWQALQMIPPGETRTYQQLAQQLNTSPRAIGGACRCNPIPIIIPCHRVVAKNGIGGFNGQQQGADIQLKRWLLAHERT